MDAADTPRSAVDGAAFALQGPHLSSARQSEAESKMPRMLRARAAGPRHCPGRTLISMEGAGVREGTSLR
jgi:hypothetical protein